MQTPPYPTAIQAQLLLNAYKLKTPSTLHGCVPPMRDPRPSQVAFITANEQSVMERDNLPSTGRSSAWDGDIPRTTSQRIKEQQVFLYVNKLSLHNFSCLNQ